MATITQREKFDSGREFAVVKQFRCDGVDFAAGQDFTKHIVNLRKLRQLFDQKFLAMLPETDMFSDDAVETLLHQPKRAGVPDFTVMGIDQLREHLRGKGIVPRHGWDRGKLLAKIAEAV